MNKLRIITKFGQMLRRAKEDSNMEVESSAPITCLFPVDSIKFISLIATKKFVSKVKDVHEEDI